jgi:hypothetical protein
MRCYFVWDEVTKQKILIPGCYGSAHWIHLNDTSHCCCPKPEKTFKKFEKEEYNKTIRQLADDLQYLKKEYNSILRILQKLNKNR